MRLGGDDPLDLRPREGAFAEKSLVRKGLDLLLFMYPYFDVVEIDWQRGRDLYSASVPQRRWSSEIAGPWVLVKLGQPSEGETLAWAVWEFAIWKATGAVYRIDPDGAVPDDPIAEPIR